MWMLAMYENIWVLVDVIKVYPRGQVFAIHPFPWEKNKDTEKFDVWK